LAGAVKIVLARDACHSAAWGVHGNNFNKFLVKHAAMRIRPAFALAILAIALFGPVAAVAATRHATIVAERAAASDAVTDTVRAQSGIPDRIAAILGNW